MSIPESVFLFLVFGQVLYLFFLGGSFAKKNKYGKLEFPPPVSLVIAARNEADHLNKLIPQLLEQNHPDFEIIIALDRCTDNSLEVVRTYQYDARLRFVEITEKPQDYSGKKFALNTAIEAAAHEILVFTDADCRPCTQEWLREVSRNFVPGVQIAIGYSPYKKYPGLLNAFVRYETVYTAFQYLAAVRRGNPYMAVGRNLSYRKSLFANGGGFGEFMKLMSGDDDLLINKFGTSDNSVCYYSRNTHVISEPEKSLGSFFKQKKRHLSVGKYYKQENKMLLLFVGVSQVLVWLTFVILAFSEAMGISLYWFFAARNFILIFVISKFASESGDNFPAWQIPIMDFLYAFYLLVMGPVGFFTKKVKWN